MSARRTGRTIDLRAIVDPSVDSGLAAGGELLAFTDAAIDQDAGSMAEARRRLVETAGEEAALRAAAVAGNFQMMNRLLDAIGVRVRRSSMKLAEELGLSVPDHLHP
ncbi:MAG: hypothetical protein OER95_06110 [Acidimicrobiia bacterium]|nr:hypothetical protein [Acidimicrobiia bacterium]